MKDLLAMLDDSGPVTGKEFVQKTGIDTFEAWKICTASDAIVTLKVGKKYLRLDLKVDGYARLSPSIMREFLNYSVIGLQPDRKSISERAAMIEKEIARISQKKIALARDTLCRLLASHPCRKQIEEQAAFFIAGDVVFDMAHAEPRPEASTGELVKGSDLDIIIVTENMPEILADDLDSLIYGEKYNLLMNPSIKEELDYIIKDLRRVRKQMLFADFKAMVAAKILHEGKYLLGSSSLFDQIKQLLVTCGIPQKIRDLESRALKNRIEAEKVLLSADETVDREELMALFYTTEEKEEIF